MKKKIENGLEKMMHYAQPRGIYVRQSTLGLYKVVKGKKAAIHEAVKAVTKDGVKGWIINMADRQRKFYSESEVQVFPCSEADCDNKDAKPAKRRYARKRAGSVED